MVCIVFVLVVVHYAIGYAQQIQHTNLAPFFVFIVVIPIVGALSLLGIGYLLIEEVTHGHKRSVEIRERERIILPLLLSEASNAGVVPAMLNSGDKIDEKIRQALALRAKGDLQGMKRTTDTMSSTELHNAMIRLTVVRGAFDEALLPIDFVQAVRQPVGAASRSSFDAN